jgi:lipopolysaccharide export LptBFGC system permease protein LptF
VPRSLKALLWVAVIAVAIVVLFTWVFPWVEERTQDPTIGAGSEPVELAQAARSPR